MVADLAGSRVTLEVDRPVVRVTSARRVSVRLAGPPVKRVVTIVTKLPLNRGESPSEQRLSAADETGIPALLVDIDGVISLWGFPPACTPEGSWLTVDGIVHFLSAEAARNLLALTASFELVWCSGWEDKANDYLPQAIGLPGPLPFLTFEERTSVGGIEGRTSDRRIEGRTSDRRIEGRTSDRRIEEGASVGGPAGEGVGGRGGEGLPHWKLAAIDRWAGPWRAVAWVDDSHDARTRSWAARRPGPTLLVETEPATGLEREHVEALLAWAATSSGCRAT